VSAGAGKSADPIVIACASDEHYVRPLAAMLRSVIDNLAPERSAEVNILQSGIAAAERERVTRGWPSRVVAKWIDADESAFEGLPLWGRMPVSTYFKLAIPALVSPAVSKVIWLDCDLIVLDDIADLWDVPLGGASLAAVQDSIVPHVSSHFGIARYAELGIDPAARYFNAGVMVVDVDAWRRIDVAGKAIDYLRKYRDAVTFWDQEGLNAALAGAWLSLEARWNHNASIPRKPFSGDDLPSIVHFAGGLKPWRYSGSHELRSLYYVYLDRTAYTGWRPSPSGVTSLVALYEESGLRRLLYPVETVAMRIIRSVSWRSAQ
jgi:lipopolysaccharide biosynthesis glycosyltransferase